MSRITGTILKWSSACLLAFVLGVVLGPHLDVIYWRTMMRLRSSPGDRLLAAGHLSHSELGRHLLLDMARESPNTQERYFALFWVFQAYKPWEVYSLLPQASRVCDDSQYRSLLASFDYVEQHQNVLNALRYAYDRLSTYGETSQIVGEMLRRFDEVDCRVPAKHGGRQP